MKVPVRWLKDYVNVNISPDEIGDRLTLSGSNVEEVIKGGEEIQNVVTGKILKIEPHPDAEKLVVCSVEVGQEEPIQIVTGAKNMKENDIVPVALHGASLPGGIKIKKGKLRGIVSNGMMCSEEELGIATENPVHGLMILPEDTEIGVNIKRVLDLENAVIDFEITSNRPDCLSVVGIARETAATLGLKYSLPDTKFTASAGKNVKDFVNVAIKDSLCKRYMARAVFNVKIGPSPEWMRERLIEAGVRPINNIVDITNFVMLELGQPMHAYDKREISTGNIIVERAKKGEKFVTLDEAERELSENVLCIKDGKTTIGIAGIMGGLNSEIKDDTTEVVFESASFDGTNIRVSSQALALRTEASSRFEKDIDEETARLALDRACYLVELLQAGTIAEGTIDIYENPKQEKSLTVDGPWINEFLGTDIPLEEMKEYLDRLELKTEVEGNLLKIEVPNFRIDINIREDIAEEVARIYGYDKVPTTIISSNSTKGGKNIKQQTDDKVIAAMMASGLNESISYSFVSPKVFDKICLPENHELRKVVKIKNPLGEDYSVMRTSMIPSMMESLSRNYLRSNEEAYLFEMGRIYIPLEDENILPIQKNVLTIGFYGNADYLNLKGIIENLLEVLGIEDYSVARESENPSYHPGKTASLYIKKEKVATLGAVHPDVCENYELDKEAYIAEIDLDTLYKYANLDKKYTPLPKYPAVTRDIALLVDDSVLATDIESTIKKQGGNLVEKIKLFDIYKGKQIPAGKKSVAYSIVYRDENKTLVDAEVNKVHDKVLKALEFKLGAQLR
ncbi:phenylalanine--tRNA ligase subunit beta [Clostridium sp. 19966]|uniref:phenylalanine--tRNA ligase subunit beta n=1 Tax=Clostridium sp. 19966 TaxID=2768166 RepID=UPI0028DDF7C0|nr:phenylalanine--tRNA ligase subunit beta [Clostridium sp. 19966]MDT8716523.1 phenylalanine--tRNA ligase subunit beta [Clostridium sp. 19966]